jgi:hypothetical protein
MNRKEQILNVSVSKENTNDTKSFIAGALWADENPQDDTAKNLLEKVYKFFSDFDRQIASKHDLYQLQGEIKGFLK